MSETFSWKPDLPEKEMEIYKAGEINAFSSVILLLERPGATVESIKASLRKKTGSTAGSVNFVQLSRA